MKFQVQEYEAETFKDIDLTGTSFKNSKFIECTFENCNLSNMDLNGTKFKDVLFRECKILGLDFSKCNEFMLSVGFKDSFLSYSVFSDMNLGKHGFH